MLAKYRFVKMGRVETGAAVLTRVTERILTKELVQHRVKSKVLVPVFLWGLRGITYNVEFLEHLGVSKVFDCTRKCEGWPGQRIRSRGNKIFHRSDELSSQRKWPPKQTIQALQRTKGSPMTYWPRMFWLQSETLPME